LTIRKETGIIGC